ncbi:2Fe-2S iron-sulfur cluster binding domain-containing protein [Massilia dura]|uniref:2Fe-2S iron-sulfur cluster binding domain-containing protein n=1 Tax=Pseudoduganella dura TaxID=321982 RepID=A0A6I3X3D0_9BURK|nr:PDR/VanB family oxidoreductase [Pseudoduganella dura]MUI11364.1 2Fe-2S iron-sulfur cluster binding domain-containing protein [Pseudoduganella dura]
MSHITVVVTRKSIEAIDIVSVELASVDGRPLPPFSAGSHIDVHIADGLVRQYSLCNDPSETHRYLIGVLRDPSSRGGSIAVHDRVKEGDTLRISAPKNHFALEHGHAHALLLAGGIGVTPVLCMAERLAVAGAGFSMHYCTRSPERTAFLDRIRKAAFADRVQFHFDTGAPDQKLDLPAVLASSPAGAHLYVCGPKGFIDFVMAGARAAGWSEERLHLEYFGAALQEGLPSDAFEVQIASTGERFAIPAQRTVTEVLAAHGIEIPISCEQGICGTCITRVLEGVPDHRDMYFTEAEKAGNNQFTPCCSRARSPLLVLDI